MSRSKAECARATIDAVSNYGREAVSSGADLLEKVVPASVDVETPEEIPTFAYTKYTPALADALRKAGITEAELAQHGFLRPDPDDTNEQVLDDNALDAASTELRKGGASRSAAKQ